MPSSVPRSGGPAACKAATVPTPVPPCLLAEGRGAELVTAVLCLNRSPGEQGWAEMLPAAVAAGASTLSLPRGWALGGAHSKGQPVW